MHACTVNYVACMLARIIWNILRKLLYPRFDDSIFYLYIPYTYHIVVNFGVPSLYAAYLDSSKLTPVYVNFYTIVVIVFTVNT
jgi:hypothetical protein